MNLIIPTVFAYTLRKFKKRLEKVIKISRNIHIDFMDGKFVALNSPSPEKIPDLKKYKNNFEAHLMALKPSTLINKLKEKGFKKIIFHFEACKDNSEIKDTISAIRKAGLIPFIALNPETEVELIYDFIPYVNGVMFMGVHPGREHQGFIPSIYGKIARLREHNKKIIMQVDGGVNFDTIKNLRRLGIDIVNIGSLVAEAKEPKKVFAEMKKLF